MSYGSIIRYYLVPKCNICGINEIYRIIIGCEKDKERRKHWEIYPDNSDLNKSSWITIICEERHDFAFLKKQKFKIIYIVLLLDLTN